ncbi:MULTISPECIES: metalloregulator ArsR/SmtB family transcription factor [Bacillaceae]|uniref:Metalloregulator ArsR/SmtB family transcription factor n=1 Tax=Cytobacillus firmus TaxID=1399 RepID=A0AA46SKL1_CYTFI|nr:MULTISPECIES: metalloregulator ArsR/SmtB family transcription factor [Bacillaceae]KML46279.1 ArsR family transcriptional regulator [Cytobacillus firmus]MBG9443430.1 ArsR family transcriptional regulator [Cytobacillus firmus]MCC3645442.1 metalloregulator ArsR/SmtB family transcription factor [Cytobacillus oceanisediminis]MCS0652054.1 metalloregulator ArsR/SmtB family transcription factor [Cytobacillus firmus]MCU1804736.1 metalloregulator ArsR/SmtB family transcription factor [Cytobacillus fi
MQLNRLVAFYKTMGDPTRIRIVFLLAKGPLHGQAIAGKLGLTPPTITHHLNKLREINLVYQRRDKNTVYFYLNESVLKQQSGVLEKLADKEEVKKMEELNSENQKVIENFFTRDGKLKNIPAQRKKKLMVFEHLIKGLKMGKKYQEKELNEYIKQFHEDYATIRREFIINHYMYRENGIYELNPPEMWAKIEG